jgi:hypothetical protein
MREKEVQTNLLFAIEFFIIQVILSPSNQDDNLTAQMMLMVETSDEFLGLPMETPGK